MQKLNFRDLIEMAIRNGPAEITCPRKDQAIKVTGEGVANEPTAAWTADGRTIVMYTVGLVFFGIG